MTMGELAVIILMPPHLQKFFPPLPQPHVILFHNKLTMPPKKLTSILLKYLPKALSFLAEALKTSKTDQYQPESISVDYGGLEPLLVITQSEVEFYRKIYQKEKIDKSTLEFHYRLSLHRVKKLEEMIKEDK